MLRPYFTVRASPTPRMHFAVRIGTQALDLKQRCAVREAEPLFRAAIRPSAPSRGDQLRQFRIAGTLPEWLAQVDSPFCVETQEPGAVGRQASAVARTAERGGCRRDDPERGAVRQSESLGRCAEAPRGDGSDGAV